MKFLLISCATCQLSMYLHVENSSICVHQLGCRSHPHLGPRMPKHLARQYQCTRALMSLMTDNANRMRSLWNLFCSYPGTTCCKKQWIDILQHFLIYFFKGLLDFFWICPEYLSKTEDPNYHQWMRPLLLFYLWEKCFLHTSPLMFALL